MKPENETGELVGAEQAAIPAIHTRKFSTKDAARVVGISVGKLQNWLTRGAIQLEGEQNPGRGQSRSYSAYEIARIALMKKLSDCGVPLETAFKITAKLKDSWKQAPGGHEQYAKERSLQSWLVVVLAADWPPGQKGSLLRADTYVVDWIVDDSGKPDSEKGLMATLLALGATPSIVVNLGKVLDDTITALGRR
jgi:DNA-binding transcriptional MerR regulator